MRSFTLRGAAGPTGLLLAVLGALVGALVAATPAHAADIYVQVAPSDVTPGQLVGIRASCRTNWHPASVESEAFGMVTVEPAHGYLTGTATVDPQMRPGRYRVKLLCPEGPNASTMLYVKAGSPAPPQPTPPYPYPTRGPATGFGGAAGGPDLGGLLIPGGLGVTVAGLVLAVLATRKRRPRLDPPDPGHFTPRRRPSRDRR
ncbi:hypothetical protein O7606_09430 [Micromonospora sp. WMMD882]|uniref:hypothetical protein n=1 Tax=Micromonospora sp. WMMD882 TaxID=3015151 RepID=UPI00248D0E11|nr:hypothetical protein [Micromonospora sp. WMMD882]WBB81554.1 hypothetical protein O7606_09430 [Micromonospora sp. WMMD882]